YGQSPEPSGAAPIWDARQVKTERPGGRVILSGREAARRSSRGRADRANDVHNVTNPDGPGDLPPGAASASRLRQIQAACADLSPSACPYRRGGYSGNSQSVTQARKRSSS